MNKLSKLIAVSVVGLSSSAMAVTFVASANGNKDIISGVQAEAERIETRETNFATANITRRIYFIDKKDNWWEGKTLEIHVWGDSLTAEQYVVANKMNDSYYRGLYYADISGVGIGAAINAQVHVQNYGDAQWWSASQTLPSLAAKEADVISLDDGTDGSGNRNSSLGTAPGSSGQVASFLDFISTCTASFASGYNAYPQLKANFIDPSSGEITQYGAGTYVEGGTAYNLNQKIAQLEGLYNSLGWIAE